MPARLTDVNGHLLAVVKDAGLEPHTRYDLIIELIPVEPEVRLRVRQS